MTTTTLADGRAGTHWISDRGGGFLLTVDGKWRLASQWDRSELVTFSSVWEAEAFCLGASAGHMDCRPFPIPLNSKGR